MVRRSTREVCILYRKLTLVRRRATPAGVTGWARPRIGSYLLDVRTTLRTLVWLCLCSSVIDCGGEPSPVPVVETAEESPFLNVRAGTEYVGDATCVGCHAEEAAVYARSSMAQSFHRWTPSDRVERVLSIPLLNKPSGYSYVVEEEAGALYQVEFVSGPDGTRLNPLRRRMDWVMGSGHVARTYFTEENGRLFQLPLTWYRDHGWDFSPGYELSNARFDRLLPDRCVACHSSFPKETPYLEGKHAAWRPGIGCERCHGPGALHVAARTTKAPLDSIVDHTIVNPARLSLDRRVDICEECHVHTAVSVLREGKSAFSYRPSQPLADQYGYFKAAGSIDVVSHADRLRQSRCYLGSLASERPLECATCHNPHQPAATGPARNAPCAQCHSAASLAQRTAASPAARDHRAGSDCVRCHMPRTVERTVPHGAFTEHWIRVVRDSAPPVVARTGDALIEPYFARDSAGPDAAIYSAMGGIVYATLATDARAMGRAATALDSALGSDHSRREALFLLGAASEQLGRTRQAIRALERALQVDSMRPDALRALAQAYVRDGRRAREIEPLYKRALEVQPALAWVRAEYADWLRNEGRRDDASREYRAALAEQPSLATAWFGLGLLLIDRPDSATTPFAEAVRLDASLAEALAPLLQVTTDDKKVSAARVLPVAVPFASPSNPLGAGVTLTPNGVTLDIGNVPPRGFVLVSKPDGTLVCAIPTGDGGTVSWDFAIAPGSLLAEGLYRIRTQSRAPAGQLVSSPSRMMAVLRRTNSK